jgi:hypothetical protein
VTALTLEEAAALAGGHCWIERRLFTLLGHWSAVAPGAAATQALDRHSQHAAWRAGQWWDRLPVLAGLDRESLVAPGSAWAAVADPARAEAFPADGADGDAADAVAYRVLLPRVAVAYGRHAATTTPVADAPAIRTLGLVRPDIAADWAEGEAVLEELLVTGAAVDAAAAAVAAAERRFTG